MEEIQTPSDAELLEHVVFAYRAGSCEATIVELLEIVSEWWAHSNRSCQIEAHCTADERRQQVRATMDKLLREFNQV